MKKVSLTFQMFLLQLKAEVQRLEDLKLLNIRNVTDAIRSEIAVFWEKCFFSSGQQQEFTPYFSGEFTVVGKQISTVLSFTVSLDLSDILSLGSTSYWNISEDFTEDLLSQHDAEIQRLKQHYEAHKELFDGVHQWEDSWRLYLELEVRAPQQLYASQLQHLLELYVIFVLVQ